jgi:GAF domain-containing protein
MDDYSKNIHIQLERTIKLAGARWAVWLKIIDSEWAILFQAGMNKMRHKEIKDHLWLPGNKAWIAGALSSGRVRSRQLHKMPAPLGCDRIYLFPNSETQTAIVVGGDELTKESQEFFKILALIDPSTKLNGAITEFDENLIWPNDFSLGAAYDPEKVFDWIIQVMSKSLTIDAAYLAIQVGDTFRIEAQWNYDRSVLGSQIPVFSARELRLIQATLRGIISPGPVHFPEYVKAGDLSFSASSFLSVPVLIGKRLIGIMVLASAGPHVLSNQDRERAVWILERLAHAIESAIVFADITRYLKQYLLLSELASAAAFETEPEQIARRLVRLLSRTFHTEQVALLLVSPDGKYLKEFGVKPSSGPLVMPISKSLLGYVVESGKPYRTGDVTSAPRFYNEELNIQSLLAAPLKYRGRTIGVIGIESLKRDAFTVQDEQLLVVIASQLAGTVENVRLMQETGDRARNLSLIHHVLGKVVGLVDLREIAAVATELVAEYFNNSLVCILLPDISGKQFYVLGVGGYQAARPAEGSLLPIDEGIPGTVYRLGKSCYSNDGLRQSKDDFESHWTASAELAVPLRSGEQILGVLDCQRSENNAFGEDDLLSMESLAGILASVISLAHRYQEGQQTIARLELVRETALDISNLELGKLSNEPSGEPASS